MTCRSWGQYNFETFDGLYYHFPGRCSYTLLRDCEETGRAGLPVQVSPPPPSPPGGFGPSPASRFPLPASRFPLPDSCHVPSLGALEVKRFSWKINESFLVIRVNYR